MKVQNLNALAAVITDLGGVVVADGPNFRFDLPLGAVNDVVPKIHQLGAGVRKISERVTDNPTKLFSPITLARLELYNRGED